MRADGWAALTLLWTGIVSAAWAIGIAGTYSIDRLIADLLFVPVLILAVMCSMRLGVAIAQEERA